jgi:hypothetical protein
MAVTDLARVAASDPFDKSFGSITSLPLIVLIVLLTSLALGIV